jgi:hypothetical protein
MKKLLWAVAMTISILVIAWFGASYIEVVAKNNTENPQYNKYNAFEMIVEYNNNNR